MYFDHFLTYFSPRMLPHTRPVVHGLVSVSMFVAR